MMWGANCSLTRFHDRSSVRMNTTFGCELAVCTAVDGGVDDFVRLLLLHAAATSVTTTATITTRAGLRRMFIGAPGRYRGLRARALRPFVGSRAGGFRMAPTPPREMD